MNSPFQKTLRLLAALVGLVGLSSCGGGGSDGPAEQAIALFSPIPDQRFSATPVPLTALSSSGLAVAFTSATPSVCTINSNTARLLTVGTCTVAADQAGDPNFLPAPTVRRSFAVTPAEQTISFVSPGNQVFGVVPAALMAVASSGLPVSVISTTPAVCSVTGTTLTLLGLGSCSLGAVQAGNATYLAATPVVHTFAVNSRGQAQTISFASPGNQVLNVPPAALVATASSGLPVVFTSTTPSVCGVAGTTLSLLAGGSCTVVASQAGDQNFAAAPAVTNTFTVALVAQNITFASPGNQTLGVQPAALAATATSGLAVTFSSTTLDVCTVNGTVLALVNVGICSVTASQAGNTVFSPATPVVRLFSVAPAVQVITFAGPGNQTLGTAPPALSATSSLGLTVSFASTTPAVCTTSGTSLALVAVGTCTITASQAGNAVVAAAVPVVRSFSVAAAALTSQTISFTSPGGQTLGVVPTALVGTASSGLSVSFASSTPAVCTVSGTALTLVTAGNCTITASQAGNTTNAAATPVTQTFSVAPAVQTITFNSPGNQTLGTPAPALVASSSAGLPVTLASTTPTVCTVSGTALTLVSAGTCTITASQAGNANVAAAAVVTRTITVGTTPLSAQTITFVSPGAQTLGTATPPLVATASSGLAVQLASGTPSVCAVSGSTLTLVAAGTCTVNASQAGNSTFAAAPTVSNSFTVSRASQSISFTSPGPQTLGTTPAALSATATSGLAVSFTSTTPGVCSVSGSSLTLVAAGTCSISANQPGDATFLAAATVTNSFPVTAAAQSISFNSPGSQTMGTAVPPLTATATSGLGVILTSTTTGVCTVSGSTVTLVAAGNCSITATQPGNAVFAPAAAVTVSFTVSTVAQTITFNAPGAQTLGVTPPALAATTTSPLTVLFSSSTPSVCTVSGTTLNLVSAGTCTVEASQPGNSVYSAATAVSRSFAVLPAAQTITFNSPGNQTLGTPPQPLVFSASSGLQVTVSSSTPSVCTVSGNSLSLLAAGSCTLTANQPGNANVAAAAAVTHTITVGTAPLVAQTITFASPGNQTLGVTPSALVATASSGLTVSFTSSTPSVCTVLGTTLTLAGAGSCTITASQAGNASFLAAPDVSRVFTVAQGTQTITFADPGEQTLGTTPPALSASASSLLSVGFASTTAGVCTVSGSALTLVTTGTCTIRASQGGDANFAPATAVDRSFSVVRNALANVGFEEVANNDPPGEFANGWLAATVDPSTRIAARSTTEFRSGAASAFLTLTDGQPGGVGLFQNSVDHGQLAVVDPRNWGTSPTLSFWLKGNVSETGNLNYALRYLSSTGAILSTNSGSIIVATGNVDRPWTLVTRTPNTVIPTNTAAILVEMTLAAGPSGTFPGCGGTCVWGTPALYIDDIRLKLQF